MPASGLCHAFTYRLPVFIVIAAFSSTNRSLVVAASSQPAWTRRQTAASASAGRAALYAKSALAALTGMPHAPGGHEGLWVRKSTSCASISSLCMTGSQHPQQRRKGGCLSYVDAGGERQCLSDIDALPAQPDNHTGLRSSLGFASSTSSEQPSVGRQVILDGSPPDLHEVQHGEWTMF